jgi:hypothetical protein
MNDVKRQRANAALGAGYDPGSGDVIILADGGAGDTLQWSFPADDIARVMLSLANAHSDHVKLSGPASGQTLSVDSVQLLPGAPSDHLVLDARLSAGIPVRMALSRSQAASLHADLRDALA